MSVLGGGGGGLHTDKRPGGKLGGWDGITGLGGGGGSTDLPTLRMTGYLRPGRSCIRTHHPGEASFNAASRPCFSWKQCSSTSSVQFANDMT